MGQQIKMLQIPKVCFVNHCPCDFGEKCSFFLFYLKVLTHIFFKRVGHLDVDFFTSKFNVKY